jgi:hypothetical protein
MAALLEIGPHLEDLKSVEEDLAAMGREAPSMLDRLAPPLHENYWIWQGVSELRSAAQTGWSGVEAVPYPWVEEWLDRNGWFQPTARSLFTRCLRAVEAKVREHLSAKREAAKAPPPKPWR